MSKKKVHIISHTHWDREWYLNSKYTNEWLIPFFDKLFNILEKRKNYVFVLDGQMSMIEDYYNELMKKGIGITPYQNKIKTFASQNKLFIGPYYLQPDWQLISEESLVRNLLIGSKMADLHGGSMTVGWLLDNFGQISQAPQIHKLCHLKGLYTWRGVEMDPENVKSEFVWVSPDGSKIPVVYLVNSYRNAMRLAENEDIMEKRIYDEVDMLSPFASTHHLLLMNGYDQEMVPDDFLPMIENGKMDSEEVEIIQSNPVQLMDAIISESSDLNEIEGPLYSGRFIAVFPGVMSARMYLKLLNDKAEKSLTHYAEPLNTLIWALGGEYEYSPLQQAWKLLLKNHPHDSICGVSIDDVHIDMEERFEVIRQLLHEVIGRKAGQLVHSINTSECKSDENYVVFNPSSYTRDEILTINDAVYKIDSIPSMGYKLIEASEQSINYPVTVDGHTISNGLITVTIEKDGCFSLKHKGSNMTYTGLGVLEDRGDAGDSYNYSYPDEDLTITSKGIEADIKTLIQTPELVKIQVEAAIEIPISLTQDRKKRSTETIRMPYVTSITVKADSEVVECRTEVKNTAKDHIVRVLFPSNIKADYAHAGSPFDITNRPITIEEYDETSIPEQVKKVIIGAREVKPNTIFLQRELVDLTDGQKGLAILNRGLPEYQVIEDNNTIAVTLFRSVGWIAREINTRIGDAGPEIMIPDAQCLRQMTFNYAVYAHAGDTDSGDVARKADQYNKEVLVIKTDKHQGNLPSSYSLLDIEDVKHAVKVTGIKRGEDGESLILRCFNTTDKTICTQLNLKYPVEKAWYVSLLEKPMQEASCHDNRVTLELKAKQIVTLKIMIKRDSYALNHADFADVLDLETKHDFEAYPSVAYVTEEEIQAEKDRAKALEVGLDNPMLRRTALEAQLSAILTQDRYHEHQTRKLGYKLNDARVKRRVYDYIKEYRNE